MQLFTDMLNKTDTVLDEYAYTSAEQLIEWVTPIFTSLMIVWIAIWGYQLLLGRGGEPMQEGAMRIIKVGLIMTLGLTISTYSSLIIDVMTDGPAEIAGAVAGTDPDGIGGVIDSMFSEVVAASNAAYDRAGVMSGDFGMYIVGVLVFLAGGALCLAIALMIIIAKVATAVLLAIGPLAFAALLFNQTQRIFAGWLDLLVNYGFILILGTSVGMLMIDLMGEFVGGAPDEAGAASFTEGLILVLVLGAGFYVLKQVTNLANALSPSVALATDGLSRSVGKPFGAAGRGAGRLAGRGANATGRAAGRQAKRGYSAAKRKFSRNNTIGGS
ncbi:MAG TPA: type IV secretion protein [Halothiobacillaceae bacterium]|nr:type IV secretion protein [Halothiobacillaceae bacterium]